MKIVFCVFLVTLNTVLVTANSYTYNARTCDPNEIMNELVNTWDQDTPCEPGVLAGQTRQKTRSASPFAPQWSRHSYRESRRFSDSSCLVENDYPSRIRLNDATTLSALGPIITRCEGNVTYSLDSSGARHYEFTVGKCFATTTGFSFMSCTFNDTATSSTTTSASSVSGGSSSISADDSSASTLFTDYWLSAVLVLGNLQSLRP
jgi:hypothetical protein